MLFAESEKIRVKVLIESSFKEFLPHKAQAEADNTKGSGGR